MMGKDVERCLKHINTIKDKSLELYDKLADAIFTHPNEKEDIIRVYGYTNIITNAMDAFNSDFNKLNNLSGGLYTDSQSFNNNYGSPWTEINILKQSIDKIRAFAPAYEDLNTYDEKMRLFMMINKTWHLAIDAKWALTTYHDYIQRGYDNVYNNNVPSITFAVGLDKKSIGNIEQPFDENVRIPTPPVEVF